MNGKGDGEGTAETDWSKPVILMTVLGLLAVVSFPPLEGHPQGFVLALASTSVGALVGLLLGIPKRAKSGGTGLEELDYSANTALEEISDWLVKLLVGATLVQLQKLPAAVESVGRYMATNPKAAFLSGVAVFFACCGFFLGYLWTRLNLAGELSWSDRNAKTKAEFYEGLMNAYLYRPPPKGFQRAIGLFDEYVTRFGEPFENWRMWAYRACAFGQQWLSETEEEKKKAARAKALEAVKKAVAINPAHAKELFEDLLKQEEGGDQDDLVPFVSDEEFRKVVGLT